LELQRIPDEEIIPVAIFILSALITTTAKRLEDTGEITE
jgi:hypothetical protein